MVPTGGGTWVSPPPLGVDMRNLLWRAWMSLRFPEVCWKHREKLENESSYSGDIYSYCKSCVTEQLTRVKQAKETRQETLTRLGVKM